MKIQLSLFVSIFLLVGQLQAQTQIPSYVPTNGLVGWWPFNGNANDESGNGNNGTVNGATLTTDRFGNAGKAYSFDGVYDYISVLNSSSLASPISNLTISAWFNINNFDYSFSTSVGYASILCKSTSSSSAQYRISIAKTSSNNQVSVIFGGNNYTWNLPLNAIQIGNYYQIAVSINSGSLNLYLNGLPQISFNSQALYQSNTTMNLEIGRDQPGSTDYFNGKLDDIGIWNRALTQQEVNELYTSSDPFDVSATTTTICAGQPTTLSVQSLPGTISSLTCASATNNGTLTAGVAASGVNSVVPYTGGNGGLHNGQTVTSTGVTGLTATLNAGIFSTGNDSLIYTITGTPSGIGTASFVLNIGGQTCTLTRTVAAGVITTLSCASATNSGTLIAGVAASGVSSVVPYTGGNGGLHNGQTVSSTGVTGLTATLTAGTFSTGNGSLIYTITGTPSTNGTASFALNIGGKACTLTRTVAAGTITGLTCASATNNGTLTAGVEASGVSTVVPYTGGNGGTHNGQTVTSTGITGLTATLSAGAFAVGVGSVTYTITGTPTSAGTASFALNIGGRTCTLTRTVNCWSLNNTTTVVEVTNPTTGKTWMDRNLGAVRQATSSTDVFGYGDIYQWGRNADGHQCRNSLTTTTLSTTDQPATSNFIVVSTTNPGDWRNPQNNNLWQGVNGINNPCPSGFRVPTYAELNAEAASWTVANAYASVLKLPAGGGRLSVNPNNGNLVSIGVGGVYWTSTISGTNSRNISFGSLDQGLTQVSRSDGMSVRCIKETVGSIGALNCGSSTVTGNLILGSVASSVSASVPYTGGNGGFYAAQSVTSTGVTGLTASIAQGLFTSNTGSLVYTITGTPSASGTANFALNIGGKSCTLTIIVYGVQPAYPAGAVFCNGATLVSDVTNPTTGKTWMDRNLGASQTAISGTDANSYGDLYQWGRGIDGHQCRNSTTSTTLSPSDQPGINRFIINSTNPSDWRNPQNTNLWQGVNGINNPCPNGYRVPTSTEIDAERLSWSGNTAAGAFASPLKLPMAGDRLGSNGQLYDVGTGGVYWSSTVSTTNSNYIVFGASTAGVYSTVRTSGYSIRCIKETVGSIVALNCGSATLTGNLISGSVASGVSASVPYTGGNGGYYASQSISSTGVTGLTATISQGIFAIGAGNLVYTISGTPAYSGTANFALTIGGQSCTLSIIVYGVQPSYPVGSEFCNGATIVNEVTNPTTGKIWMDRNLGASQVATSSTDAAAYGDLYQWGRRADKHQCRNSSTISTLSSTDTPAHGRFILTDNEDWRDPSNSNLWQGVNGINNPCPNGYKVPTETELNNERNTWSTNNSVGAFSSPLKLTFTGFRNENTGAISSSNNAGYYWTSNAVSIDEAKFLSLNNTSALTSQDIRASGRSVRCIKN